MGDLQCPARVFLVAAEQAAGCVDLLRSERIAAVYAVGAAAPAAAAAARTLQVPATSVGSGLAPPPPTVPTGPPASGGSPASEQVREALADIADRHRGEAVLLVDEQGAFAAALRPLVPGWAGPAVAGTDALVALEADADGWRRAATSR